MKKIILLSIVSIGLACLTSCSDKPKPQSGDRPPVDCPKTNPKAALFCPPGSAYEKVDNNWQLKDKWTNQGQYSSANWQVQQPAMISGFGQFASATFSGTDQGNITCFYTDQSGKSWITVKYTAQSKKPCDRSWNKQNDQCAPSATPSDSNRTRCPIYKINGNQ
jgi:hypothetical protein